MQDRPDKRNDSQGGVEGKPAPGAAPFDEAAWLARLRALNPWADGLEVDDENDNFVAARKAESLRRYEAGRNTWNDWAAGMLALRREAEVEGVLSKEDDFGGTLLRAGEAAAFLRRRGLRAANSTTRLYLALGSADFSRHEFKNHVDYSGFKLPGPAIFDGITVGSEVEPKLILFNSAHFYDEALFESVQIHGNAQFDSAHFDDGAWFEMAHFHREVSFVSAHFLKLANFNSAHFQVTAHSDGFTRFDSARFHDEAKFNSAHFFGETWFDSAKFTKEASFQAAHFHRASRFNETHFCRTVSFHDGRFYRITAFAMTEFHHKASFRSARFHNWALFDSAHFHDAASFDSAKFYLGTSFYSAQFEKNTNFSSVRFCLGPRGRAADFTQASFKGPVTFKDAEFAKAAVFTSIHSKVAFSLAGAKFARTPDFIEATFHQAPRLDHCELANPITESQIFKGADDDEFPVDPRPPGLLRVFALARDGHEHARLRKLRAMAADGKDHENEILFNAYEIAARRFWVDKPGSGRFWLGWLYGLISGYGRSIARPIAAWAVTALLFWGLFFLTTTDLPKLGHGAHCHEAYRDSLAPAELAEQEGRLLSGPPGQAALLSLRNALVIDRSDPAASRRMFGCLYGMTGVAPGKESAAQPVIPSSVMLLSALQSILSAVLLFLAGLGVRNMFRMKGS